MGVRRRAHKSVSLGATPGALPRLASAATAAVLILCGAQGGLSAAPPEPAQGIIEALSGLEATSAAAWLRGLAVVTVLSTAPALVLLMTCYPRVLIVLSFLRRAMGTPDLPSSSVLAGLTLILSGFIMLPVWRQVHAQAYLPLSRGELKTLDEALVKAAGPVKSFMLSQTALKDLRLFAELSMAAEGRTAAAGTRGDREGEESQGLGPEAAPAAAALGAGGGTVEDLSFFVVFPAFVLSELKLAFQMGFMIFIPFLVIDLAVAAILLSMGMFMLPPMMVSLPLKVLVFVLVDGWNLVVVQLIKSFQTMS